MKSISLLTRFPAKRRLIVSIVAVILAVVLCEASEPDNIRIIDDRRSYKVQPSGKVKVIKQTTYEALRADDHVLALTMFNEDISIDKASAPGATPYYRSWEDEDLFYTGSRICLLDVPLTKGKAARVTFEQTYRTPEQFCNVFLSAPYATEKSLTTVEIPACLADRYKVVPMNLDSCMAFERTVEKNGNVIYNVTSTGSQPYSYESDAPSASVDAPQLIITGVFADTDELYDYFRKYCPQNGDETGSVSALSEEIISGCGNDFEKIDSIASWVRQNIRYVAVEHGEYGIRPEAAASVLAKRYGDCKGSASLIKSLLHAAGVDGRLVWIGTSGEVSTRWDSVPLLMSGNHQIAAAVVGDSIVYVDGTAAWSPAGYIPPSLRGQQALIEDGDSYMLRDVPDVGHECDTDTLKAAFSIVGNDLCGWLEHDMGGVFKMSVAGAYHSVDQSDRRQLLGRILSYPKKNISCPAPRLELAAPAAQRCRIVCDSIIDRGAARVVGDKLFVDLRPVRDMHLAPTELRDRRRGVVIPFGYTYVCKLILDVPEGYEVETLPARHDFDTDWYGGFIAYSEADGRIVCDAEVHTLRRYADVSELETRNAAIKGITRASESKIVLKKTIEQNHE